MQIRAAGRTDVGCERDHNEDACLMDTELGLYIVCDGMGGHTSGEVASQETLHFVHRAIREQRALLAAYDQDPTFERRTAVVRLVDETIQAACAHIYAMGEADPVKRGMGTTIALLLTLGDGALIAHVGDSRVYLIRDRQAFQLTEDHSLVWHMVKAGKLAREDVATWPYSNVITRCIGGKETVQVDTLFVECLTYDRFLLCSDGFHNYVDSEDALAAMSAPMLLEDFVQTCITHAYEGGGRDNVTVVVVQVETIPRASGEAGVTVMRKVEALKRIRLFSLCETHELVRLLNIVHIRSYEPGEVIVLEDTVGDEFFIVISGKVEVLSKGQRLMNLGPGAPFGETALLERVTRSATVRALETTKAMLIHGGELYSILEQEPAMAVKLFRSFVATLHQRLRATNADLLTARRTLATLGHPSISSRPEPAL